MRLYERTKQMRSRADSLSEIFEITAGVVPERAALIQGDVEITFRVLVERMRRVASFIEERGIVPGDRVAVHIDNSPEFAYVAGGILMSGAVLVAMNVMYLEDEVRHILNDSGARILFALDKLAPRTIAVRSETPLEEIVVIGSTLEGCTGFDAVLERNPRAEIQYPSGSDLAMLQYTSGTTGRPKGAMLTHRNVVSCLDKMANVQRSRVKDGDILLLPLPLFHCYGLILGLYGCLTYGTTTVLVNRFDAVEIFRLFEKHRVTLFYGAPPMFVAFVNAPGLEQFDVSSLERCGSGAAPLPVAVLEKFKQMTGVEIMEGYGLTESAPTICTNANAPETRAGTVGFPLPGVDVRIVDESGRDVPTGEIGELIARGDNIFVGYWKNEDASRDALRDGWFYTGDLARQDADGYYSIVDRKKDMILVSGYNVYPAEIENVLFRHPKVADAAVIGLPHPYQGEAVKAIIVPRAQENPSEEEIIQFVRERLAAFKVPKSVAFVQSLPKNRTGKVLKRVLRDQYTGSAT